MAVTTDTHFAFTSKAMAANTFSVVRFRGAERLSRLYEYDVLVSAADADIDLDAVLRQPATLTIRGHGDEIRVNGVVSRFEQQHEIRGRFLYRATLVPRLAQSDLFRENQLFLDRSVPEIIEAVLKRAGLSASDYSLKLKRSYPKSEYVCQYDETDFAFISRWMEREGLYYYFQQEDDREKLVITDSVDAHEEMAGDASLRYVPRSSMAAEHETVTELVCRQTWLPNRVILRDYNYRKPSLDLRAEAVVDASGRGEVFSWGEHFKTPEEGKRLAEVRAEEIRCTEQVFHGEATAPAMHAGALFSIEEHYRDSYNRQYLLVEVTHEGVQPEADVTAASAHVAGEAPQLGYRNSFDAIASDVQFRPSRTTPWPQVTGTVNARVDAAGDGKYAEIDDQGRYKVRLPFDESAAAGGKASRWVRMSQPHSGPNYGMHFPLHKDSEVLLTFIDGDPDRPIIAAAVPNPETSSPVSAANQTQSVIRTGGQNEIVIEDTEGGQKVTIRQACGNSFVLDGTRNAEQMTMNQACGNSFVLDGTKGAEKAALKDKYGNQIVLDSAPGDEHISIYSPHHNSGMVLGRSIKSWTKSNTSDYTVGNKGQAVLGTNMQAVLGTSLNAVAGNNFNIRLGQEIGLTAGGSQTFSFGYSYEYKMGPSLKSADADILNVAKSDQVLDAGDQMCLVAGTEKGGLTAALNLSKDEALLSIGAPAARSYLQSSVSGDIAGVMAAMVFGSLMSLGAGEAGAALAAPVAAAGVVEAVETIAVLLATKDDKVEPAKHSNPDAFVKLDAATGEAVVHSEKHNVTLRARNGDVVLVSGPNGQVRVGKYVRASNSTFEVSKDLRVVVGS